MPSLPANADAPFRITRLSHVILNAADVSRSVEFYTGLLGLVVTEATAERAYLRGTEEAAHHSLVLQQQDAPSAERIGFRVATDQDLDAAKQHFDAAGLPAAWVEVPYQGRTLQVSDVAGVPIEFCVSMPTEPRRVLDYHEHRGAGAARIDHVQVHVRDFAPWLEFHTGLGFRVSEYAALDDGPDAPAVGAFLSRKGDLLDFVGVLSPGPRLHHVSFLVHDASYTLARVADIASGLGLRDAVEYGPARHGLAPQQFLYLRDPDGHRAELVSQGYQFIDPELEPVRWSRFDDRAVATWGPAPSQAWFEEASSFRGITPQQPEMS